MTNKYDVISIKNIEAFSKSGVFEAEKALGQVFIIDINLHVTAPDSTKRHHDEIGKTIDYAVVSQSVRDFVRDSPTNLIEAMAHNLAGMILDEFELCMMVGITVHKPYIPVDGFSGDVSISIERTRK